VAEPAALPSGKEVGERLDGIARLAQESFDNLRATY
jgi:hypothetical protein